MENRKTKLIVFTSLFSAIVCLTTFIIKIPTMNGYIHIGDSMIYIASNILPFPFGMIAGGIGGAFSDMLGGYWIYVIPTFIVKNLNGLCFYILKTRKYKIISIRGVIAGLLSSLVTVVGYFFVNALIFDFKYAIVATPAEITQGVGAFIVFVIVGLALDRSEIVKRIKFN